MLSKAFEWYRIVDVQPTSPTIDNRKAAATKVIAAIDAAGDWDLALSCAAGVAAGFDTNHTQDSQVVKTLVDAIREHESAFPQDLTENALELRACAATVLGEILVRDGKSPSEPALLVASILRSAFGARQFPKGKHLKQMLEDLDGAAADALSHGGIARRTRSTGLAQAFDKLEQPADVPAAWKALIPPLKKAVQTIAQQAEMDREELNVLWWMFAGASSLGKQLAELPAGAASLCCGAELGSQCLLPPTDSLEAMVRRAYEAGRKPQALAERTIEKIAADWDNGKLLTLLAPDDAARELSRKYPVLFPLSWLSDRLLTSKGASGWGPEFERVTSVPITFARPSIDWATQAFRERVAQRTHAASIGE